MASRKKHSREVQNINTTSNPDKATSVIDINDQPAAVAYEAGIHTFRGKFLNVYEYCDFVATDIKGLHREGGMP